MLSNSEYYQLLDEFIPWGSSTCSKHAARKSNAATGAKSSNGILPNRMYCVVLSAKKS